MNENQWNSVKGHLKRTFGAGLLFLVPVVVTAWVLALIFNAVDSILGPGLSRVTGVRVPGLGLIATLLIVYMIGLFASNVIGKRLIGLWDTMVTRVPLVRGVYRVTKEVSEAFGRRDKRPFRQVVTLEFPRKGLWTLGFLTAEVPAGARLEEESVFVFIPTTPNPTSGWLVLVPKNEVRPTPYTVDEGMRIIVSAGIVTPAAPTLMESAPGPN